MRRGACQSHTKTAHKRSLLALAAALFLFLSSCATLPPPETAPSTAPSGLHNNTTPTAPTAHPVLPPTGPDQTSHLLHQLPEPPGQWVDDLPYAVHYEADTQAESAPEVEAEVETEEDVDVGPEPQTGPRVFTDKSFLPPPPNPVVSVPDADSILKEDADTDAVADSDEEDSDFDAATQPLFADDMDRASLLTAIDRQLEAFRFANLDEHLRLGSRRVTKRELKETLVAFRRLLRRNLPPAVFNRAVHQQFEIIEAGQGRPGSKRMQFTGYYTPILDASRQPSAEYPYPLYRKPEQAPTRRVTWNQPASNRDYGFHLSSRTRNLLLTRQEIDGDAVLQDHNLEIAWLKDDLDRYFLHIQGSGYLKFTDGTVQAVRFNGSNELPYKSVGRQMINDGVITEGEGSMQGIKGYFRRNPHHIPRYLFQNRRYIFFELADQGPTGSAGVELVPGRALATDKTLYPGGGLAFITAKKPVLDADHRIVGWEEFSRFVLDQDTGSAIRGPKRGDLYFGVGPAAGAAAGHYNRYGRIVYLLKK